MMIQFITLIISLIIQFGTSSVPYELPVSSVNYQNIVDLLPSVVNYYNSNNNRGNIADIDDVVFVTRYLVSYTFYFSRESMGESNINSSYYFTVSNSLPQYSQWNITYSYSGLDSVHIDTRNMSYSIGSSVDTSLGSMRLSPSYDEIPNFDNIRLLFLRNYPDIYNIEDDNSNDNIIINFDGHFEPTVAPSNLDFTGHSNVTVSNSNITTENGNIIQNILGKMNNAINSLGNIVANGFNGVYSLLGQINNNIGSVFGNLFSKISYILYIPSADEIVTTFNGSLLGQNLHLFSDVENSVRDNLIITTPDNFVINFSFMFFGTNIPFVLDMNGLFGSVLMSRLRSILTAFIYVGCVLLVIHELPHTVQGLNGFGR